MGAAWIVSALPPRTPFFSAEPDPLLAASTAELFAADPNVTILAGAWQEMLPPEAPFDLLFVDGGSAKDEVDATLGLLAPGGTAVLDDFWFDPALPDPRRDAWLRHPLADHDRALGDPEAPRARRRAPIAPSDRLPACR